MESLESRTLLTGVPAEFMNPHSVQGDQFGASVTVLTNGNVVITAPNDDAGGGSAASGTGAGAVYLFNGQTGALISTLTGSHAGDLSGATIISLTNGNFVIRAPEWNNNTGSVTFGNGVSGVTGVINATNSLVGTNTGAGLGGNSVTPLLNGNYIVDFSFWGDGRGAVTFGSGTTGVAGSISSSNSLIGANSNDHVGASGITALSGGNYVIDSPLWNGELGAVTFGNGKTGTIGTVSSSNSLIGSHANDSIGAFGVTALNNGNYVVESPLWSGGFGAVTFGSGAAGVTGTVSSSNSLVGSHANDNVGQGTVTALNTGNYVVESPAWNGNEGAVTFGNGLSGVSGIVSSGNSLVGTHSGDKVGSGAFLHADGITSLSNGNYVINSPYWNSNAGAVTLASGTRGITGAISVANSLIGSQSGDEVGNGGAYGARGVTALNNGNYVVDSSFWSGNLGAVTLGNGASGITGTISAANSLVGNHSNDIVGAGGITALLNGNYVVNSFNWNGERGAVTLGNGKTGLIGTISSANSLVGTSSTASVGNGGITALSNGNYVVADPYWNNGLGEVTFGNGVSGTVGTVSANNSLIGSTNGDSVSSGGVTALSNGNYVIVSPSWNGDLGAVTFGKGSSAITGTINASNSLIGSNSSIDVGNGGVVALKNGRYAVLSSSASGTSGAVTFGGGTGAMGALNSANSVFAQSNAFNMLVAPDNIRGRFYAAFPEDGTGHVFRGSAVTGYSIPSKIVWTQTATTGIAGTVIVPAFTAKIEDQNGNTVTLDNSAVTISVKSGPGKFASSSTLTVTAVNGVATFSNLILDTAGVYTLTVTDATDQLISAPSSKLTIAAAAS